MACNPPIVSTNVGDVAWILGKTNGCYISSFDELDFARKIKLAIQFSATNGRTLGRQRLMEIGLGSDCIAKKIIKIYYGLLATN